MKKSNIFAYIELSKLVEELRISSENGNLRQKLKSKSAYFNILEPRYFSDSLVDEWESILLITKNKGAKMNEEGKVESNAASNTIDQLSETECRQLVQKVYVIYEKVKQEFK